MLNNDREDSQENSINKHLSTSRQASHRKVGDVLITNAQPNDSEDFEDKYAFIKNFTTDVYG